MWKTRSSRIPLVPLCDALATWLWLHTHARRSPCPARSYRCLQLPLYGARAPAQPWAVRDLGALCALATDVASSDDAVEQWAPRFTRVTRWDLLDNLDSRALQALLRAPSLRHVQARNLSLDQDLSQQQCQWEALEVQQLEDACHLLRLPSGVGRVAVTQGFTLHHVIGVQSQQQLAAVLQRWCAPGRLRVEVDKPPPANAAEFWRLGAEEAQGGFFRLAVPSEGAATAHAPLLQRTVLPQGGGPRTLWLSVRGPYNLVPVVQELASLLAGTHVRALCTSMSWEIVGVWDLLSTLPACITSLHVRMSSVEHAREVLSGPAATHPLRLALVVRPLVASWSGGVVEQRELRELCAAHQPLVRLEVVWELEG